MTSEDIDTLKAFVQALAQQQQPLPESIQQAMPRIGHALEQPDPVAIEQTIEQLRTLVNTDASFRAAYDRAYRQNLRQYQVQERTKSLGDVAVWESNLIDSIARLLITDPSPASARRFLRSRSAPSLSHSQADEIREKGNRLFAMAAGGAFLGGAIAQVPGAIVGIILATVFGWFSSPTRANPDRVS